MPPKSLKIDIYSDVVCPWCWLGKRRLEKALEGFPGLTTQISFLPYELDPGTPAEGKDREAYLTAKYGGTIAVIDARIAEYGKEVGLEYHFGKVKRIPNSFKAHRLVQWAGEWGLQGPLMEALHAGYFRDGKDLADDQVLAELAASAGLDGKKALPYLQSGGGEERVRELEAKAYDLGIPGVPFFVFDDRLALSGAHPIAEFQTVIREVTGPV